MYRGEIVVRGMGRAAAMLGRRRACWREDCGWRWRLEIDQTVEYTVWTDEF